MMGKTINGRAKLLYRTKAPVNVTVYPAINNRLIPKKSKNKVNGLRCWFLSGKKRARINSRPIIHNSSKANSDAGFLVSLIWGRKKPISMAVGKYRIKETRSGSSGLTGKLDPPLNNKNSCCLVARNEGKFKEELSKGARKNNIIPTK